MTSWIFIVAAGKLANRTVVQRTQIAYQLARVYHTERNVSHGAYLAQLTGFVAQALAGKTIIPCGLIA